MHWYKDRDVWDFGTKETAKMKYMVLILAILTAGCAANRVSITDTTLERSANEKGRDRCSIAVGENMLDKRFCIIYRSENCHATAGDCESIK